MLDVHLLGEFRVLYEGQPCTTLDTPRLQALFAYLILNRSAPQPRHHIAFLLWPDSSESHARASLRFLLHELRRALPGSDRFLSVDAGNLQFRPDAPLSLDVEQFTTALAAAEQREAAPDRALLRTALERAVNAYQGDLVPSCYDEWIATDRERLRHAYLNALEQLVGILDSQREYRLAIEYAQRLLRHDPAHEATYQSLMRLHNLIGDRPGALRVYHACVTALRRELDVEPSPETREAYARLLTMARKGNAQAISDAPATTFPLVGRAREWQLLQLAWSQAVVGSTRLVLLTGEAGIGKSRLAEELLRWVSQQGFAALDARTYPGAGALALAPIAAWLRKRPLPALARPWLRELARLLPELAGRSSGVRAPEPPADAWQRRLLFEATARALLATQPLLLVLDDIQWCDEETLDCLGYLLQHDRRARLLVLCTQRSEEEAQAPARLAALLAAQRRDQRATEITLGPLDDAEAASLAGAVGGAKARTAAGERLVRQAEGNPLFIVELLGSQANGENRQTGSQELPPTVRAVIQGRLGSLSPHAAGLARVAAVIGRDFDYALLARCSDDEEDALMRSLDELWRRRIVREQSETSYEFSHPLIREVAYGDLSAIRRRSLHRCVGGALESVHAAELSGVSAQIADHYDQGGLAERALIFYQTAAAASIQRYAARDAIEYLEKALSLSTQIEAQGLLPAGKDRVAHVARAADLYESLGDVHEGTGDHGRARSAFAAALRQAQERDSIWRGRLKRKIGNTLKSEGAFAAAGEAYADAATLLGQQPGSPAPAWWHEWLELRFGRMWLCYMLDRADQIAALADGLGPIVREHGTVPQRAEFFQCLAVAQQLRDRFGGSAEAVALARSALAGLEETGDIGRIADARFKVGYALLWQGELEEAESQLKAALQVAEQTGLDLMLRCLSYLAILYRKRQQVSVVDEYVQAALRALPETGERRYAGIARGNLAWVAWRRGQRAAAESHARSALDCWQGLDRFVLRWIALWPLLAVALAAERGGEAVDCARQLLDPRQQPLPAPLAQALAMAIEAWNSGQTGESFSALRQALSQAQTTGYA